MVRSWSRVPCILEICSQSNLWSSVISSFDWKIKGWHFILNTAYKCLGYLGEKKKISETSYFWSSLLQGTQLCVSPASHKQNISLWNQKHLSTCWRCFCVRWTLHSTWSPTDIHPTAACTSTLCLLGELSLLSQGELTWIIPPVKSSNSWAHFWSELYGFIYVLFQMQPPCPVAHQWPRYFKVSTCKIITCKFSLWAKSVHRTPEAASGRSKSKYLTKKGNIWSSWVPWMVFEMLSSFPRPHPCNSSSSWNGTQIPHQESRSTESRPCLPCHFNTQRHPE